MFNCRRVKPVVHKPIPEPEGQPAPPNPSSVNPIGIVVGHNERGQGATNYQGESEWLFNSRIAKKLQMKLFDAGVKSVVIYRPKTGGYRHEVRSVVKELEKYNCSFSIHLHFNSAGKGAKGVEVLIAETATDRDNAWADVFSDMLNETYGFYERGRDGIKTVPKGHNGAGMLYAVKKAGITPVLPEPCFGDYRTKESALIFEQEDKYVDILRDAVLRTWK